MRFSVRSSLALLVLALLAAYANSLGGAYVFDDIASLVHNSTLRDWRTVCFPPGGGLTVSGRPVLNISFALSHALGGGAVWAHHVVNLLIHVAAGLTLFGVVRRTLLLPGLSRRFSTDATPLALLIALLWSLHPLQTESVTYLVQRAESLMGLFFLLTFYAYLRGVGADNSSHATAAPPRAVWLTVSVVACLLGIATKEVVVAAPLLVLLHDRAFVAGSFRAAWHARRGFYLGLFGTWVPLAALVLGTGANRGGTSGFDVGVTAVGYWLTQFEAITRYLALSFWPHPLVFEYGTFWTASAAEVVPYAAVVVPLVLATLWALWRRPALGFLGFWFFAILAPTSIIPGTIQMIVEHRMYLPLAAVLTITVLALYRRLGPRLLWIGFAAVVVFSVLTERRNRDYRSELTLWGDTVAKRPANASAHNALGLAHLAVGANEAASTHLAAATRLSPTRADYRANYAGALARCGQLDQAIAHYTEALRLSPRYAEAHSSLSLVLAEAGRGPAALHHAEQAVRLAPGFAGAHSNLGVVLLRAGRPAAAAQSLQAALALDASLADAHNTLGVALVQLGRRDEAALHFKTALRLRPGYHEARDNLAQLAAPSS